ncbi:hypothetical protein TNIN_187661 [Trichonephila inaurata madagascariensis]|uniref:Uncharacterized protein n=1 Tax=Trichonephila inaurata madagascariensis TaxID=2747483 RepID=A0A8X7BT58_9ARAC|nr:hypothetical protein TNIN_187661 [Trichonephila inaurata madagascariensis]
MDGGVAFPNPFQFAAADGLKSKKRASPNNGSELLIFKRAGSCYLIQDTFTNCQHNSSADEFVDRFACTHPIFVDETEVASRNKLDKGNFAKVPSKNISVLCILYATIEKFHRPLVNIASHPHISPELLDALSANLLTTKSSYFKEKKSEIQHGIVRGNPGMR